jgi:mRNA interferase RelE/StbE
VTYEIELTASALRSFDRIPVKAAHAVIEFVFGALADNPRRVGKQLKFRLEGHWSARRGDFRIVYVIDEASKVVIVKSVAHRSDAYR